MVWIFNKIFWGHIHVWEPYGESVFRKGSHTIRAAVVHPVKCKKCGKISSFEVK